MQQTSYRLQNNINFLYASDKPKYVFTIRETPLEDRPREKLVEHGSDVLGLAELVAVILGTGTKKEDVLSMSRRIIKEYGEVNIINERNPSRLSQQLEIPVAKASQIVAAVEIGRRLFERKTSIMPSVRNAQDIYEFTQSMHNLPKEHLKGIYLNGQYRIIHEELISVGTVDASIIHPREVLRPALERSAVGFILVHNHPSGELTPSEHDIQVTLQIKEAGKIMGIELLDHVIVSENGFISMSDENLI